VILSRGSDQAVEGSKPFAPTTPKIHILHADDRTFHPDFDAATYSAGARDGISDTRQIRVLANATKLCIVVRDGTRSNTGLIYLPLAPNFSDSSKANRSKQ
jgi:hypothetical protein